jgi:Membrane domain of glycerophosphoryl diester phosphodiesterase.
MDGQITPQGENATETAAISIGSVLGRSWRILVSSPRTFFGLAFIAVLPTLLVILLALRGSGLRSLTTASTGGSFAHNLLFMCVQGAAAYAVYRNATGRTAPFGESLRYGFARLPSILGTSLLMGLVSVLVAFLFIILPGGIFGGVVALCAIAMIYTRWVVAIPICAVENKGAFESVTRSSELTEGNRMKVFAVIVILFVPEQIVERIAAVATAVAIMRGVPFAGLLSLVVTLPLTAYQIVTNAVLYYELRTAKEGTDIEALADVFD